MSTTDPTAPLHQAPDADERAGIEAALAEALENGWRDAWANKPNAHTMHGLAEALAPAVAGLIEDARREDRERLALVKTVLRRWGNGSPAFTTMRDLAEAVRAALSGGGEQ